MQMKYMTMLLLGFCLGCGALRAQPAQNPSREYQRELERGIELFYETRWREASELFGELKRSRPDDPRAYFFDSMIPFWNYFFVNDSEETARRFFRQSRQAIAISRDRLQEVPTDTNLVLLLSGLHGYRSLVAAGEKDYRIAIQDGMDGFSFTRQLLQLDSDDPRALIGKGLYYYMAGTVPGNLRWVANLAGFTGNREEGLEMLEQSAASESYVSNDARMILAYLYKKEEQWERALYHIRRLCEKYPSNTVFRFNYAEILEQSDRKSDAMEVYREVVNQRNPDLRPLVEASRARLHKL